MSSTLCSLQVSITGQLGMKGPGGAGIPITATNLRIQGKDVLRLPPSSITTDAKGQTVLRITPDMMATLAKSPVATVKLTPDFLSTTTAGSKGISATLHVTSPSSAPAALSCAADTQSSKAAPAVASTLLKAAGDAAIRLMPTLAVGEQKTRTFSAVSSPDKSGATIRIMPGLGVIPQKQGQTITMTTTAVSKPLTVTSCANVVTMAASVVAGAKGITVAPGASGSTLTMGTATATVRQVPATVVTTQTVSQRPCKEVMEGVAQFRLSFASRLLHGLQGAVLHNLFNNGGVELGLGDVSIYRICIFLNAIWNSAI